MTCTIVMTERVPTAVVKVDALMNKLPEMQRAARSTLAAVVPTLDAGPLGLTCTRWRPPANGALAMEPGMIVSKAFAPTRGVVPSELPEGRAAHHGLKGPFDGLPAAWKILFDWCAAENLKLAGVNWEIYGASHPDPAPAQQETSLYALLA